MYSEQDIEGKGIGCVANKDIKKGNLILGEAPVLKHNVGEDWSSQELTLLMEAYEKLGNEDKVEYMKLSHSFSGEREHLSNRQFNTTLRLTEEELKVWKIFETNAFENGVYLKMSRFNHACSPNAEYWRNTDFEKRDLRARRYIKKGEEITVTYIDMNSLTKMERQEKLREDFNFYCRCEFCNKTENEIQIETVKCEEYRKIAKEKKDLKTVTCNDQFGAGNSSLVTTTPMAVYSGIKAELECVSKMYKIRNELKLMKNQEVLTHIVEQGFNAACQGIILGRSIRQNTLNPIPESDLVDFKRAADDFANVGEKISVVTYGKGHSISRDWKERKANPIQFFSRRNN